jgi:hypothetical protein
MKRHKTPSSTLQFRLSVTGVKPEIWRLLLVSSDTTLAQLHIILQILMGWQARHLYAFVIDGKRYSPPHEDDGNVGKSNLIGTRLSSVLKDSATTITYEYDFGDRWEIELHMAPMPDQVDRKQSAECIEGCRHGPAEDSGGSRGYMEKIQIFSNPEHKRYQQIREKMGPDFNPEAFDLLETNELLKNME